jgi:protein-S-isoprenylcysteine O-methyltransferase Ste14
VKNANSARGKFLLYLQIFLMAVVIFAPKRSSIDAFWALAGLLLLIASIIIFLRSKRDLAQAFYPYPEPKTGAPFITSGIYARVRHPMYLAFLLGSLGLTLIKQSFLLIVSTILLTLVLNIKYRFEDRLLSARWDEAKEYQKKVPALIPLMRHGSVERLDPNDNQYRRMKFHFRGASGINGQTLRRLDNFTNPKPLDEEDM